MKVTLVLMIAFMTLYGCSSSKSVTNTRSMEVVNATFTQWSEPPSSGTDVPERGTDLHITLRSWPEECTPEYVVYNFLKSYPAEITERTDSLMTISARIIRTSGMIQDKSESLYLSDRLVFTTSDGESEFIEINEWQRAEN